MPTGKIEALQIPLAGIQSPSVNNLEYIGVHNTIGYLVVRRQAQALICSLPYMCKVALRCRY